MNYKNSNQKSCMGKIKKFKIKNRKTKNNRYKQRYLIWF